MRASSILRLGVAAFMTTTAMQSTAPAGAAPAYTADKLIAIFAKDKAALKPKTRTIHLDSDQAPDPAPTPTQVDLLVSFEFNSDRLTAQAKENLDQVAAALKAPQIKGTKFEVDGHTDATGTEQYNQALSERRANAVFVYLVSQGVDADTLRAKGFGKSKPKVRDPYSAENRRVEGHVSAE